MRKAYDKKGKEGKEGKKAKEEVGAKKVTAKIATGVDGASETVCKIDGWAKWTGGKGP